MPLKHSGNYNHNNPGGLHNWVIQSEDATTSRTFYMVYYDGSAFQPAGNFGAGKGLALTNNAWNYIVYVKTGTSNLQYQNGSLVNNFAAGNSAVSYAIRDSQFNSTVAIDARFFTGVIDEARISAGGRSADWILTEYRNQSAPGTYISAGPRLPEAGTRVRHEVRSGG